MLLWFAGGGWVVVWAVFHDPAIDYRLVVVGALLPDVVDGVVGVRAMHTLSATVALLLVVMAITRGRRVLRRRLLAIPIGALIHLVLDGVWTAPHAFWWPSLASARLPSLEHPVALVVAEEVAGAAALVWCIVRFELLDQERRSYFWRTGRLGRDVAGTPG